MTGLFLVVGGGVHYLVLYMSWKRQKEFVERYIKFARNAAWGGGLGIPGVDAAPAPPPPAPASDEDDEAPPVPRNRRERRMYEKESRRETGPKKARKAKNAQASSEGAAAPSGPSGARKRIVAENGKVLVVDSLGDVYLEEEDEEGNVNEFLLDVSLTLIPYLHCLTLRSPMSSLSRRSKIPLLSVLLSGYSISLLVDSSQRRQRNFTLRFLNWRMTRMCLNVPRAPTLRQMTLRSLRAPLRSTRQRQRALNKEVSQTSERGRNDKFNDFMYDSLRHDGFGK